MNVGVFRCPVDHPAFRRPATVRGGHLLVFPRTSVIIRQAGHPAFVADPNAVVLYHDGQEYDRRMSSPAGDVCEWFGFGADTVAEAVASHLPSAPDRRDRPFPATHAHPDASTYLAQRRLVDYLRSTPAPDSLMADEAALAILRRVVAACHAHGERRRSSRERARRVELAEAARERLGQEFEENHTLGTLAAGLGCSEYHLSRVFSETVGIPLHRYRDQLRLRSSLPSLTDTDERVVDIALNLGFSSHSHFTANFRRAFGMTPSQYRQRAARGPLPRPNKNLIAGARDLHQ